MELRGKATSLLYDPYFVPIVNEGKGGGIIILFLLCTL